MSEPIPESGEIRAIIDTDDLAPEEAGSIRYAMRVREHISNVMGQTHKGLAEDQLAPLEARLITAALEHLDLLVLRDIAIIGGVQVPGNGVVAEAFVMNDDQKAGD